MVRVKVHGEWLDATRPRFGEEVGERFAWTATLHHDRPIRRESHGRLGAVGAVFRVTAGELDAAIRPELIESDIVHYIAREPVDAAVALFHVVSYLTSETQLETFAANVARSLKPGGLFLFDFWYGPAVLAQKPEVRVKQTSNFCPWHCVEFNLGKEDRDVRHISRNLSLELSG